ncbi:MAG: hypothetical protein EOM80_15040 [Erysipelotrichia bacterium]|nr:hypothetical protein [Erysipelotrichia bacterium]
MIKKRRPGRPIEVTPLPQEYSKKKYTNTELNKLTELGWFHNLWVRFSLRSNKALSLSEKRERILAILEKPILPVPKNHFCSENLLALDWYWDDENLWPELGVCPLMVGELYKLESQLDKDLQVRGRSSFGISKRKVPDDGSQLLGYWEDAFVDDAVENSDSKVPITVNLDFEDSTLIEHFALLLKRLRKKKQIPEAAPAREKINWDHLMRDWVFYKVLPYIDLMLWGEFNQEKITARTYLENLPSDREAGLDANQISRTTKNKAAEVFSSSFLQTLKASLFYKVIKSAKCKG